MPLVTGDNALRFATSIDNSGLKQGTASAQGIIRGFASNISKMDVFAGLALGGVLAFEKIASSAFNMSKDYEQAMLEVATISEATQEDFEGMSDAILKVGTSVPQTAIELSNAFYQIASAGFDGAEGLTLLEISAKAAVGGVTDVETAADGVTTVMNAWKISADGAEEITDKLFKTVKEGKTTFPELSNNMSQVASIAASANIPLEEILGAIATLTKQGVPTAQAFTQIKSAILSTSDVLGDGWTKTMTFQEGMKAMADQAGGSQTKLKDMVGRVEAMNAVLGLTGENAAIAAQDLLSIQDSAGAAGKAFETMVLSTENQSKLLAANIEAALKPFGDWLLENYKDITTFLNEAFKSGDIEKFAKAIGIGVSALVAYKTASKLSSISMMDLKRGLVVARKAMRGLNLAMKANPWGLLAAGIAAAVTAFIAFNDETSEAVKLQTDIADISATAEKNIISQKNNLNKLLTVARDETKSLDERKKAVQALNKISPKYLGDLKLSTINTDEAKKATEEYTAALLKNAQIQAAKEKIVELEKQRIDIILKTKDIEIGWQEELLNGLDNILNKEGFIEAQRKSAHDERIKRGAELTNQIKEIAKIASQEIDIGGIDQTTTTKTAIKSKGSGDKEESLNYYDQLQKKLVSAKDALLDLSGEEINETKVKSQKDYIVLLEQQINDQEIILGLKEATKEETEKELKAQVGSIKYLREKLAIEKKSFEFAVSNKKRAAAKEQIDFLEKQIKLLEGANKVQDSNQFNLLADSGNALGSIGDSLGSINSELGESIQKAGALLNDVSGIAAGLSTGNYMQAALSGLSLVANLVSGREKDEDRISDLIQEQNVQIRSQIKLLNEAKGVQRLDAFTDSLDLAATKQIEIAEEIKKLKDYVDSDNIPFYNYDDERAAISALEAQLEELKNTQGELISELYSTVTGTTASAITDSIFQGFSDGKSSILDFASTFEDLMRQSLLEAFNLKYLQSQFDDFYTNFAIASESGGELTASEIANLKAEFNENIAKAEQGFQAVDELFQASFGTSINIGGVGGGTQGQGLSGEIQSKLTEQTGSVLAGTMNSIRLFIEEQNSILTNMGVQLGQIVTNTDYNKNLERLENIELLLGQQLESLRSTGA